jgi:inosose dehydratase
MAIRVANAPVSWGINEHSSALPLSATQFLDQVKRAGYAGTELGPLGFLPANAVELAAELDARGLALVSAFVPLDLLAEKADLSPIAAAAPLLSALGARLIVLSDMLRHPRPSPAGEQWTRIAKNLEAAQAAARAHGLACAFHHHGGCAIETRDEVARLLDLSSIPLCLDTGHFVYGGGDPVEAARTWGSRIGHLHLKDIAGPPPAGISFPDAVSSGIFRALGQGCICWRDFFNALDQSGYSGWAVVEQDIDIGSSAGASQDPFKLAQESRAFLRANFNL